MGTSHEILIDMPTALPLDEAEAVLREALSHMPWHAERIGRHASLDDDLPVSTPGQLDDTFSVGQDGLAFRDGRVLASLDLVGLQKEVGGTWCDGVETDVDHRMREDVLFEALERLCSARPGEIVGHYWNEHLDDAGPIVVTSVGLRRLYSRGDVQDHRRTVSDRAPLVFVHPGLLDADKDGGWSCRWNGDLLRRMLGADPLDALRAHAEAEAASAARGRDRTAG